MTTSLQGNLLVAAPRLMDPNFLRSIILIVQHTEAGALGLMLNRPMDITVQGGWKQVSEGPCFASGPIYQGGPCDGPLMVLHGQHVLSEIEVIDGVYFSTEKDALERLVLDTDSPMKFFVGYAGWTAGQLESEMEEGGWLTISATRDLVFSDDAEQWNTLARAISRASGFQGMDPGLMPDDPSVN